MECEWAIEVLVCAWAQRVGSTMLCPHLPVPIGTWRRSLPWSSLSLTWAKTYGNLQISFIIPWVHSWYGCSRPGSPVVTEEPKHSENSGKVLSGFLSLNKYRSLLLCGSRIPGTLHNSIKEQNNPDVLGIIPLSWQSVTWCVLAGSVDVTHSWILLGMTPTEIAQLRSNSKGEQMLLKVGEPQSDERGHSGHFWVRMGTL
jgi:hypothetical protein